VVRNGADEVRVPVEVTGLANPRPISFANDLIPILTKATCNAGGFHGKAEGQNGFKLSAFGHDPPPEPPAITQDAPGPRMFAAPPGISLFLLKATGRIPHGGGKKIEEESLRYRRLARWLSEGAGLGPTDVSPIVSLEVEPAGRVLVLKGTQQIRVTAIEAA